MLAITVRSGREERAGEAAASRETLPQLSGVVAGWMPVHWQRIARATTWSRGNASSGLQTERPPGGVVSVWGVDSSETGKTGPAVVAGMFFLRTIVSVMNMTDTVIWNMQRHVVPLCRDEQREENHGFFQRVPVG